MRRHVASTTMSLFLCVVFLSGIINLCEGQELVAYYSFDTDLTPLSGFCPARSGAESAPAVLGTSRAALSSTSVFGQSVYLNGDTVAYGQWQIASTVNTFTLMCWARLTSNSGSEGSVFLGKDGSYSLYFSSRKYIAFSAVLGGTTYKAIYTINSNIPTNVWLQIAGVYDGTNVNIYVNGSKISNSCSGSLSDDPTETIYSDFAGYIDEVKIFARSLSDTQVAAEFSRGAPEAAPVPVINTGSSNKTVFANYTLGVTQNYARYLWQLASSTAGCSSATLTRTTTTSPVITFSDVGTYRMQVVAWNPNVCTLRSATIAVAGLPPALSSDVPLPSSLSVVVNQTGILHISVSGYPTPTIRWQYAGVVFDEPGQRRMIDIEEEWDNLDTIYQDFLIYSAAARGDKKDADAEAPEYSVMHDLRADFPNCTLANLTSNCTTWINIDGATRPDYIIPPVQPSQNGTMFRVQVTNYLGTFASEPVVLLAVPISSGDGSSDGTDGADGADGTTGHSSDGGGTDNATIIGAVIGSVVGACAVCCCLLIILVLLIILLGRRGGRDHHGFPGIPPDYDDIVFTNYLNPQYRIKGKQQRTLAKLEQILVDDQSFGVAKAIAYALGMADEDVTRSLVFVYHQHTRDLPLLKNFIAKEIADLDVTTGAIMFRSNSVTPRLFKYFALLCAVEFLWKVLAPYIWEVQDNAHTIEVQSELGDEELGTMGNAAVDFGMEVDPTKMDEAADPKINTLQLWLTAQKIFSAITRSHNFMPADLREVLAYVHDEVAEYIPGEELKAMGAFLFLRFFCPGLLAPQYYGLLEEAPLPTAQRQLILVTKVLQNLANDTLPGHKENYMSRLNEFITNNQDDLRNYFRKILGAERLPMANRDIPATVRENSLACLLNALINSRAKITPKLHEQFFDNDDDPILKRLNDLLDSASLIPKAQE